jgi:hypothetical protein
MCLRALMPNVLTQCAKYAVASTTYTARHPRERKLLQKPAQHGTLIFFGARSIVADKAG